MNHYQIKSGFTLIELLIVVAIIGILAAIAVPNFLNAQIRAKVSRVQSDLKSLATVIETYQIDHNQPPDSPMDGGIMVYAFAARYRPLTTPVAYLSAIPVDPFLHHSALELDQSLDFSKLVPGGGAYGYFRADHTGPGGQYNYGFHKWMVSSSGPDGQLQYVSYYPQSLIEGKELCAVCKIQTPTVNLIAVVYDSSNGIISAGDIIRWGGH